jgi:hypothetical protein
MPESESTGTGKWAQPGVPHKGWSCIGIDDLGEPSATCEMCERQEIRCVHTMRHPDYPDQLECGWVCAGHMEQDLVGAQSRESRLRNAASRRKRWLSRKWKTSAKGNPHLSAGGFHVTVYPSRLQHWAFHLTRGEEKWASVRWYLTEDRTKLAVFDMMVGLAKEWATDA